MLVETRLPMSTVHVIYFSGRIHLTSAMLAFVVARLASNFNKHKKKTYGQNLACSHV